MTDSNGTWKAIPGFSAYQASRGGEIRSTDRQLPDGRNVKGVTLRPKVTNKGYLLIGLTDDEGEKRWRTVHRLVLTTFVGPCPPGQEARHLNDDPLDNRLANLEWGTPEENMGDRIRNGPPKPPPAPPKPCIRCGDPVDKGGCRCHACVVEIGEQAAPLLASRVPLEEVGKRLD